MSFWGKRSRDKKKDRDLRERLGIEQKQFEAIQETFRMFDKDNSHSISHSEFKAAMMCRHGRSSDHEIDEMIRKADQDNSGTIEFEEFAEMMAMKYKENCAVEVEIRDTFCKFDSNKDGFICRKELQVGLEAMGEGPITDAQADEIIRSADKDGDGVLCMKEFKEYILDNQ